MMNDLDRFALVMDVIDRLPALGSRAALLRQQMSDTRLAARAYTREHSEDDPVITNWTWPDDVTPPLNDAQNINDDKITPPSAPSPSPGTMVDHSHDGQLPLPTNGTPT